MRPPGTPTSSDGGGPHKQTCPRKYSGVEVTSLNTWRLLVTGSPLGSTLEKSAAEALLTYPGGRRSSARNLNQFVVGIV